MTHTHYKIVNDETELLWFINNWLPELMSNETFYLCLFARSKYCKDLVHIKSDKIQMKRFTADKDWMYSKIRQLECPIGSYRQRTTPIPQEALALYITPNPRNMETATRNTLIKTAELLSRPYNGYNIHSEVMSEIQKSKGRTVYVDFDFDGMDAKQVMIDIEHKINADAVSILATRGGCHVLVDVERVDGKFRKTWYNEIRKHPNCDIGTHNMIPVPGCTQGGFTPYFIK